MSWQAQISDGLQKDMTKHKDAHPYMHPDINICLFMQPVKITFTMLFNHIPFNADFHNH